MVPGRLAEVHIPEMQDVQVKPHDFVLVSVLLILSCYNFCCALLLLHVAEL